MTETTTHVESLRPVLTLAAASGLDVGRVIDVVKTVVAQAIEHKIFNRPPSAPSMLSAVGEKLAEPPPRANASERASAVARRLGVATPTVLAWVRNGVLLNGERVRLRATRIGTRWAITKTDLNEFLARTNAVREAAELAA